MDPLPLNQQQMLKSWAERRDEILRDISVAEARKEALDKSNIDGGLAFAALENQISEAKGRLMEITIAEDRHKNSVSLEVADLISQKSRLEAEVEGKEIEIEKLDEKREMAIENIRNVISLHEKAFNQVTTMDQIVGHVRTLSDENISQMKALFDALKKSCEEIINTNGSNVAEAKIILNTMQRYIVEMAKPMPVRRVELPKKS